MYKLTISSYLTIICDVIHTCAGFFCRDERQLQPAKISEGEDEIRDALGASRHNEDPDEYRHVGFGTEVRLLFQRELKHNTRNKKAIAARFALTTFMSLLVGNIFYGVGEFLSR